MDTPAPAPAPAQQGTGTGTPAGTVQRPNTGNVEPQKPKKELTAAQILKERQKAEQALAQAQANLAKLKKQDRKIDAHFKIMFGGWIITACRNANRPAAELAKEIGKSFRHSPHPDLIAWLEKLDKDAEEKRKRAAKKAEKKIL